MLKLTRETFDSVSSELRAEFPELKLPTDCPFKYVGYAYQITLDRLEKVVALLEPKKGERVFEIGPGPGYLLYILKQEYGCVVSGCDIADRVLYKAALKKLNIPTVVDESVERTNYGNLSCLTGTYDMILANQCCCLKNWTEPQIQDFLTYLKTYLKPGGRLYFHYTTPPGRIDYHKTTFT